MHVAIILLRPSRLRIWQLGEQQEVAGAAGSSQQSLVLFEFVRPQEQANGVQDVVVVQRVVARVVRARPLMRPVEHQTGRLDRRSRVSRAIKMLSPAAIRRLRGDQSIESKTHRGPQISVVRESRSVQHLHEEKQSGLCFVIVQRGLRVALAAFSVPRLDIPPIVQLARPPRIEVVAAAPASGRELGPKQCLGRLTRGLREQPVVCGAKRLQHGHAHCGRARRLDHHKRGRILVLAFVRAQIPRPLPCIAANHRRVPPVVGCGLLHRGDHVWDCRVARDGGLLWLCRLGGLSNRGGWLLNLSPKRR